MGVFRLQPSGLHLSVRLDRPRRRRKWPPNPAAPPQPPTPMKAPNDHLVDPMGPTIWPEQATVAPLDSNYASTPSAATNPRLCPMISLTLRITGCSAQRYSRSARQLYWDVDQQSLISYQFEYGKKINMKKISPGSPAGLCKAELWVHHGCGVVAVVRKMFLHLPWFRVR